MVRVLCDEKYNTHSNLSLLKISKIFLINPLTVLNYLSVLQYFVEEIARISGSKYAPVVPTDLRESRLFLDSHLSFRGEGGNGISIGSKKSSGFDKPLVVS